MERGHARQVRTCPHFPDRRSLIHFLSLFLRAGARQYTIGADTEAAKIEWMRATQDAINQVMLVERV